MVDTSFMDDVIFPTDISRGSTGGPDWPAEIVKLASSRENRNTRHSSPLRTYDVHYGFRTANDVHAVMSLYLAALGRIRGFRYLDWADYKTCAPSGTPAFSDQQFGVGDGVETVFQMTRTYSYMGHSFVREIAKPYGTVLIGKNGSLFSTGRSIDMTTGIVTFDAAPANGHALTWGGTFHTPVRFDSAMNQAEVHGPMENIPSIFLQELRL